MSNASPTLTRDRQGSPRTVMQKSIHLVLSSRTRGLVGAEELKRMKPTTWLINASRGLVVEEQGLISALRHKQIAGSAIDVFDTEPLPPFPPCRMLDNV